MKHLLASALLCSITLAPLSQAANSDTHASDNASMVSAIVLVGSMSVLAAAGNIVVDRVEEVADGSILVLKNASGATTASIKLSKQALQGVSLAAGTAVDVMAVSTGHTLLLSGKVIAYIPNAAGNAMLHHSKA